jgi:EAL domain-containing protein (putative c-di-GMP-specific phosphodiesterase class I)/CheY-like chemotaxis protein
MSDDDASGRSPDNVARAASPGRVLIVDDEPDLLELYAHVLGQSGFETEQAPNGSEALRLVRAGSFDVVLSDINMPGMDGLSLLRLVRETDLDVPILLITGNPAIESAVQAVEYGALRYLIKPVDMMGLVRTVTEASRLGKIARLKREALEVLGATGRAVGDRAGLEALFALALDRLWMAYQPIVRWSRRRVFAWEALVRSDEPRMASPHDLIDAAERLGRVHDLGRAVRRSVASTIAQHPETEQVFVNVHPLELDDEDLHSPRAELSRHASRVVLEITERASLERVKDVQARVLSLRELGFRVALDDLGTGYAGLASFAQLQPDIVKLDIALVRSVHTEPTKLRLVRSMIQLCGELGMLVIAEGIEEPAERDALVEAGCDLLQGFLFARPDRPFPGVRFG